MRTAFLIVGAILSGLYTLVAVGQLICAMCTNSPVSGRGITEIAASAVPPCIGGIIFLSCISWLRRKNSPEK